MYVDALGLVSDAQALSATGVSTNAIDTQAPGTQLREIGTGEPIGFGVSVDVAADAGNGDETYQFDVISDDAAALSSPTVIYSQIISRTLLTAGSEWFLPMPPGFPKERYIGLRYTLGGTTPSITVTAHFTSWSLWAARPKTYAKGYTIS